MSAGVDGVPKPQQSKTLKHEQANITLVSVSQVSKLVRDKKDLFKALTIEGQLFLPPYRLCGFDFLKDILRRKKSVFKTNEIVIPNLPVLQHLSVQKLIDKAKKNATVMQYLPDEESLTAKRTNKQFIAAIINTLDPRFIPDALKQHADSKLNKSSRGQPATIEIDKEMLEVL